MDKQLTKQKFSIGGHGLFQHGVSTLSMAFVVFATGLTGVGMSRQAVLSIESSQGKAQGVLLDKLNNAVNTYLTNNFLTLINNGAVTIPTGGTIAAGSSLQPTLAQLQGMGVLDATFQAAALNGGAYQILITRAPNNCWLAVPNNCNLQSQVWINQPFLNTTGTGPSTRLIQSAVTAAEGSVGTSNRETPATINGPSWSLPNPVAGTPAGILMAVGGYASSAFSNYLPLRGGTMIGGIDMGTQSIANASSIASTGRVSAATVQTSGDTSIGGKLVTTGAIRANGDIVSATALRSGTWQPVVPGWAAEAGACETGSVGRAAYTASDGWAYNGKSLTCVNGFWAKTAGSSVGNFGNNIIFFTAYNGQVITARACFSSGMSSGASWNHYVYPIGDNGNGTWNWGVYTSNGSQVVTCWL